MSIGIYIIEYSEIELKLRDFVDSYSDLNGHFLISEVNKGSLLTIYTDQNVNNLALELQVPVAKLHKIDQSSRRKSPIKLVALDMYGSSLLVLNNNMKLISENATFGGTLLCNDEINQVKILKSHLPIMEKSGGPINHLAKAMVGTTMRLEGSLRNWISRRNHFGRICDFQTFLRRVHLKQELDDLMLFCLTPVQAS